MTTRNRVLLGMATCWPFVFLLGSQVFVYKNVLLIRAGIAPSVAGFIIIVVAQLVTLALLWLLVAFYWRHVDENEALSAGKKRVWKAALFVGNMVVMPLYWYRFVWHQPTG